MENKNKVIIAGVIVMALAIGLIISKGQAPEQITPEIQKIDLSDKSDSHQTFARPSNNPVQAKQKAAKKLVQSKIAKFQKRARSNSTTLVPTKAHEFHNPEGQSLTGARKGKAVAVKAKKKGPVSEADKKKAAELAKNQAFIEEQCGDIKDNQEKAECHQAVAFYLNQQKKNKAIAKAKKEKQEKEQLNQDTKAPTQTADNDFEAPEEDTYEPEQGGVVPNNVVNNNNETDTQDPNNENSEDDQEMTLEEWRDFLVVTDEAGGDLFSKAWVLLDATKKSGKESLSVNNFYILIREFYLQSGNAELEVLGIQTLNGVQSLLSFRNAVAFFSQENIASSNEQLAAIEANIRNTYQQESQLSNLNIFINTFALPTTVGDDGQAATTPWNRKDPLFLTLQYIRSYSEAKLTSLVNTVESEESLKELQLINPLTSIQSDLNTLVEEADSIEVVRTDAASAQASVTLLLDRLKTLQPEEITEPETQIPTTLTNFSPR